MPSGWQIGLSSVKDGLDAAALRRPGSTSVAQAVSSLPSMAKRDRADDALLAALVVVDRHRAASRADCSRPWPWTNLSCSAFAGRPPASTANSVSAAVPLIERPGPPQRQVRIVEQLQAKGRDVLHVGLDLHPHRVLGRRVALGQERAVRQRQVLLAAGRFALDLRPQHRPLRLVALALLLPGGHALRASRACRCCRSSSRSRGCRRRRRPASSARRACRRRRWPRGRC